MKTLENYIAPTEHSQGDVGDIWIDKSTGDVYKCTGFTGSAKDLGYIAIGADATNTKYVWEKLGGSNSMGIKTAIIKEDGYDNILNGVATASVQARSYTCTNMSFEEAWQSLLSGEPLAVMLMMYMDGAPGCGYATYVVLDNATRTILLADKLSGSVIAWTSDQIIENP